MHESLQDLLEDGPVLTDGAWGTQLAARGLPAGECPELWNVEHPDRVEDVARTYVAAGSGIILTNTFGGCRVALARHGLEARATEINRAGAGASKRAAADGARVFASMGPCGKMLVAGEVSEDELRDAFGEQAQALADGGADGIVIETMTDLDEARVAVAAALTTGLPVVACMVFDSGPGLDRTLMGVTPEEAARELTAAGAHAVGANCGQGVEGFVSLCERMAAVTSQPIWIKANAGLPVIENGAPVWPTSPEEFASHVPALLDAGAMFLGGCCGTSPEFIRALSTALAYS